MKKITITQLRAQQRACLCQAKQSPNMCYCLFSLTFARQRIRAASTGITNAIQYNKNHKRLANAKRPCDCHVLCLRLKSSLCSCEHSISDMTSFSCRDQGRDSVCPVL